MILLSPERQCFSRTNKRSARRRPPHPLRRTESNRDLAYLIRTLLRFSAQTRTRGPSQDGEPRQRLLIRRFTQLWWEALPEVGMCRVDQHHARHLAEISKPRQPTYPLTSRPAAGSGRPAALQSAAGRARAPGRRPARTPAAGRPAPGRSAPPGHGRLFTPNYPPQHSRWSESKCLGWSR